MNKLFLFISILSVVAFQGYAQQRITGGSTINITDAPWQVILKQGNNYICGGSIIAPNYILTAKHCVDGISASSVKVVAGITCKNEAGSNNTFNVSEIILHPTLDVALLKLSTNISYNNSRRAINYLASTNSAYYSVGTATKVSGWGWLTPNGYDPSECLNGVDLHIISNQDASTALGETVHNYEVACTGVGGVRQGACQGDSGGPLVTWSSALNEYVLIGIVSWGRPGCTGDNSTSPSVFVRTSSVASWISGYALSLSGPTIICSDSPGTFTANNAPSSGSGYTWTQSSNLTPGTASGNSKNFTAKSGISYNGAGWIAINVEGVEVTRKIIYVGTPVITITGSRNVPNMQSATYVAETPEYASPTSYQWILSPQLNNTLDGANSRTLYINFYTAGTYQLICRATNSCGQGEYTTTGLTVYNASSYSLASPNPVSDVLTVSFNPELVAQAKASLQSPGSTQTAKRTFLLTIKLYDNAGTLQRQTISAGENITLDVSALKNGLYILHVHDGMADKPEVHKILVSH
jgi:hypothetical protein